MDKTDTLSSELGGTLWPKSTKNLEMFDNFRFPDL